jgi:hypothetical protein
MSVILEIAYVPSNAMLRWSQRQALDIACRIAAVPGLHWKLWARDEKEGVWTDIHLFGTEASARVWEREAKALLAGYGAIGVTSTLLLVDEAQSTATRGPIPGVARVGLDSKDAAAIAAASISSVTRFPFPEIVALSRSPTFPGSSMQGKVP